MNRNLNDRLFPKSGAATRDVDQGLRAYMLHVYNYMGIGLGITGLVAYLVAQSPEILNAIYNTPLRWVVMLAPLAFAFLLLPRIWNMSTTGAQMTFFSFATVMGVSISFIFMLYTGDSIARTFFITAGTFGAMSLYGYTTGKDLTGWGSFLFMGLIGLIIASVVNIFLQSSGMQFVISAVGVLIFTGLTAYDTQQIKMSYNENFGHDMAQKSAIYGALNLYMDFINLFLYLLRFFGDRR